ncbi:hypothetical protein V8G54_004447, partial [Vigna mungo]
LKCSNCFGIEITLPKVGVSGSKPEPAEAKLTPVIISLLLRFGSKYGGNKSFRPKYEAIKSVPSFPLVNLPVETWLTKSLPYGGKLLLKAESMKLLFPGSTVESPNTYMAETSFLEASMVATKHGKIKSKKSLE